MEDKIEEKDKKFKKMKKMSQQFLDSQREDFNKLIDKMEKLNN